MGHRTDEVSATTPTYEERIEIARQHRKKMKRAFKGITPRRVSDSLNPEFRHWMAQSRNVDGILGRGQRREVERTPGKKTRRLGAKTVTS